MQQEIQISAYVSESTKDQLDKYVDEYGIKKVRLVEDALLHHLQALREIPQDVIVPARLVVSAKSGEAVVDRIRHPRKPTAAS